MAENDSTAQPAGSTGVPEAQPPRDAVPTPAPVPAPKIIEVKPATTENPATAQKGLTDGDIERLTG